MIPSSKSSPPTLPQVSTDSSDTLAASAPGNEKQRHGRFLVLRGHAHGGLGEVSLALDQTLHRKVALKQIRPDLADNPATQHRFLREAEITGQLEHPGIVPVYALGQDQDGRPYYAMRFVEGRTLEEVISKYHASPDQVAFHDLLRRFLDICRTVAYAHSQGVIHRDLKPANVMVGKYGETLILDWGLARRLHAPDDASPSTSEALPGLSAVTQAGQVVGTPAYMAPEQSNGACDVGPAADIYSLGAILFQILTGQPPHGGPSGAAETFFKRQRRSLRDVRRGRSIPRALEAICLKALQPDAVKRYQSAAALAGDVEHWLADEPVEAYREPLTARALRWSRRHKAVIASAAVLVTTGVIALAISNVLISRARDQKAAALAMAEAQRARSDANFSKAIVAVRDTVTGIALGRDNVPLPLRRKFTSQAIKFYESLIQEDSPDPTLRYDSAVGYRTIGMLHTSWQEFEQAEKCYRKAIALLDRLSSVHPAVQQYRYQLAYAHLEFSRMLNKAGRFKEAQPIVDRGLHLFKQLSDQNPNITEYIGETANFYLDAIKYNIRAGTQHGDDPYRSAVELLDRAAVPPHMPAPHMTHSPDTIGHKQRLLGVALRRARRLDEAERMFRHAIRLFESLRDKQPDTAVYWHFLADTHREVGHCLLGRKKPAEAEQEFRQAIAIHEQRVGTKIADERVNDLEWSLAYLDLARLLIKTDRIQEAAPLVTRGVEVNPGNDREPLKPKAQIQLGDLLREAGKIDQALATYSEAIMTNPDKAEAWGGRAACFLRKGEYAMAAQDFTAAIKLKPEEWWYWHERGYCHAQLADRAKAVVDYTKVIELQPDRWEGWYRRAHLYHQQHQSEKAQNDLASAARLLSDSSAQNEIAWKLATDPDPSWRNPKLAVELAERAVAARPGDGNIWNTVGAARCGNGEWKEAISAFEKSMELRKGGDSHDYFFLAMAYHRLGRADEARQWFDKGTQWMDKNAIDHQDLRNIRVEAETLLTIVSSHPLQRAR